MGANKRHRERKILKLRDNKEKSKKGGGKRKREIKYKKRNLSCLFLSWVRQNFKTNIERNRQKKRKREQEKKLCFLLVVCLAADNKIPKLIDLIGAHRYQQGHV